MRSIHLFVSFPLLSFVIFDRASCAQVTVTTTGCECFKSALVCINTNVTAFGPKDHCNKKLTHLLLRGMELSFPSSSLQENSFTGLTKLRVLHINNISLTTLPENILKECYNLENFALKRTRIQNLSEGLFSGLKKLKRIDLSDNLLEHINVKLFSGLRSLELLTLSRNKLTTLPQLVFSDLDNLKALGLSGNQIRLQPVRIFAHLKSLKNLDLSSNNLHEIKGSDLSGLVSLQVLNLEKNRLSVLPLYDGSWPATLQAINVLNNNITTVNEEVLKSWLAPGKKQRFLILSSKDTPPLRDVSSLRSLLREGSVETIERIVGTTCRCGSIKKGNAEIMFCVEIACGGPGEPKNWIAGLRRMTQSDY